MKGCVLSIRQYTILQKFNHKCRKLISDMVSCLFICTLTFFCIFSVICTGISVEFKNESRKCFQIFFDWVLLTSSFFLSADLVNMIFFLNKFGSLFVLFYVYLLLHSQLMCGYICISRMKRLSAQYVGCFGVSNFIKAVLTGAFSSSSSLHLTRMKVQSNKTQEWDILFKEKINRSIFEVILKNCLSREAVRINKNFWLSIWSRSCRTE